MVAFSVVLSLSAIAPAVAKDHPFGGLDMYSADVDAATAGRLATAGLRHRPDQQVKPTARSV